MDGNGAEFTASKIFDVLDLMGKNFMFMHNKPSKLSAFLKCNKVLFTPSSFEEDLKNNLFRVDCILIESDPVIYYSNIKDITTIPIVFICNSKSNAYKEGRLKMSNFDCAYRVWKEDRSTSSFYGGGISSINFKENLEEYGVEDLKNSWTSNLKELKVQFIRDRNLKDLFGEE